LATLQVPGPLATGDDLVIPLVIPNDSTVGVMYATACKSPVGQPIRLQMKIAGQDFGPIAEIPEVENGGTSGSGVFVSGSEFGNVGGAPITLDILQVGSDNPGEDLTIYVTI
jgi:hypothetical protein